MILLTKPNESGNDWYPYVGPMSEVQRNLKHRRTPRLSTRRDNSCLRFMLILKFLHRREFDVEEEAKPGRLGRFDSNIRGNQSE
jgi:hypothetical protein